MQLNNHNTCELKEAIEHECNDIEGLKKLLAEERRKRVEAERNLEEEHKMVLTLQSKIELVKNEKEKLIHELEIEEEHMTNTLQKKLNTSRQEKKEIEMEVFKLKDQMERMGREREITARKVEEEEEFITNTLTKKLTAVMFQKHELERSLSRDSYRQNTSTPTTRSSSIDSSPSRRNSNSSVSRDNSAKNFVYKFL